MTQVSKYPISKEVYQEIFEVFLKTIADLNRTTEVGSFIKEFLSPTEQIMLAKRFSIALLLVKGYDYKTIEKILRVSTSTIRNVGVSLKHGSTFKRIISNLLANEKTEEFWTSVVEKVTGALAATGSKSGTWIYLKETLKKRRKKPF